MVTALGHSEALVKIAQRVGTHVDGNLTSCEYARAVKDQQRVAAAVTLAIETGGLVGLAADGLAANSARGERWGERVAIEQLGRGGVREAHRGETNGGLRNPVEYHEDLGGAEIIGAVEPSDEDHRFQAFGLRAAGRTGNVSLTTAWRRGQLCAASRLGGRLIILSSARI